jgi:hypothetical protein
MSKGNVVSIEERRAEVRTESEFLDLLDQDIKHRPEGVQPIPSSLFLQMDEIRALADRNRRRELLKG